MLDLRGLAAHWTEAGAREVFESLVSQCVKHVHPGAKRVRPDPGDDGVDCFVGEFVGQDLRIWQSKYFPDGVGDSQKKQIRESWKACTESAHFSKVTLWTLCVPIDLSIEEHGWWQTWRQKQAALHNCRIELWQHCDILPLAAKPALKPIFDLALRQSPAKCETLEEFRTLLASSDTLPIRGLQHVDDYKKTLLIRKLEAAAVTNHRAVRTAFYNFELLREHAALGAATSERQALDDLIERVRDLWESAFNGTDPSNLGAPFFTQLNSQIERENAGRLATSLPAHLIHKKGALYYLANLCEAGWTADFSTLDEDE